MSVYESLSETQQYACRVIADHARSTAFSIADGILPGNEGRNYVLRKIMRRAIYHGREHLGLKELFFYKVCDFVVGQMHEAYPELEVQRDFIGKMVRLEEERFGNTLGLGLQKFLEDYQAISQEHIYDLFVESIFATDDHERQRLTNLMKQVQSDRQKAMKSSELRYFIGKMIEHRIPPFIFKEMVRFQLKSEIWDKPLYAPIDQIIFEEVKKSTGSFERGLVAEVENSFNYPEAAVKLVDRLDAAYDGTVKLNFKALAKYYDTYGLPSDLIRVKLAEVGISFPDDDFTERFETALQELQKQSGIGQTTRKSQISPAYASLLEKVGANRFHGYETTQIADARVVAILDGDKQIETLSEGEQGSVVLNETPFYAEAGGQVGDMGYLSSALPPRPSATPPNQGGEFKATVADTFSPVAGLIIHKVKVDKGAIKVGDTVTAIVDVQKRDATRRNHTATHLVHAALREVLGTHVKQAGSVVAPNYLRFDFTHYQPMTDVEIAEVEDLVNRYILENHPVNTNIMAIEEAMHGGAMALFGEKYGSDVRVLSVGDGVFSKELCGGTHVKATGDIGSFKIIADEAIASGVRRIRAITGFDAFERFREDERLIDRSLGALKTQRDNLPSAIERLQEELKRSRKEAKDLKLKVATYVLHTEPTKLTFKGGEANLTVGGQEKEVAGVKVLAKTVEGLDANGTRQLSDTLLARLKSGVVVLGRADEGKVSIIVRVSNDLTDKVRAGDVIREIVPIVGGKGGGRPDMAEGGGTQPEKLSEAIEASYGVIERMVRM